MTKRNAKAAAPKSNKPSAPAGANQPITYKFEFDDAAVRLLVAGLDKLPGEVSRPFVNFLERSCASQDAARNAPKAPAAQPPAAAPAKAGAKPATPVAPTAATPAKA